MHDDVHIQCVLTQTRAPTTHLYMDTDSACADCMLRLCKYVIVDASVWCPKIVLSLGSPGRTVLMVREWVDSVLSGSTPY